MAPLAVGSVLKSTIDLISLFKTNVDIKGAAVTFEEVSLVAQVAKHLQNSPPSANAHQSNRVANSAANGEADPISVIYSKLFVPGTLTPDPHESPGKDSHTR